MLLASLFALLWALASPAAAATWYFLEYNTPSGAKFTGFSGEMVIPKLQKAGTYYLWPGLQPTDNSGVYQNVLDGRSGTWWIGSGWCCQNPNLPWGNGFNTYAGDIVSFSNELESDNSGWTSTLSRRTSNSSVVANNASNTFPLASKTFNQAIFAIELWVYTRNVPRRLGGEKQLISLFSDGVTWDFGQLEFRNVTITATGKDSSWCTKQPSNYNSASIYSLTGAEASTDSNGVTCTIQSVILEKPK